MTHAANASDRPRAFSYLRFSTPEQMKGDSLRRQLSMARDYARRRGLDLDETLTFHDLGVSGFRGQNLAEGRLAYFREAVREGLVPQGSFLLIEQLDRLSRLTPRLARRVLEDIIEAGITVVTLNDERQYSPETLDDPIDLIVSIMTFMRANEEGPARSWTWLQP
jgi:DNA invertase Pin-like site-specific DNA recombinase